ncbi:MAG TPA: hypothetical protein VLG92_03055 [Candidatus Saccharimonadia bacterium]|nr:hypothetical protein [Candidatus Saccharimonadia bacterium]
MEPQGTPTPSEKPNEMPEAASQPADSSLVNSSPNVEEPSQPVVVPSSAQSTTEPAVETPQATPQEPASPVQSASQPVADMPQPTVQPVVGGMPVSPVSSPKSRKRWFLPLVAVVAIALLAGGGYVFAFYLPNQPGAIYSSSLKRTGEAVDTLVNYSNTQTEKHYKSYGLDGKLTVTADGTNFDATLNGSADVQGNATGTLKADVMGSHVTVDLRSIHVADSASPDLYFRASGVKTALDAAGASSLDGLDGQWLSVDHTLLNSYATNYGGKASVITGSMPTAAESHDAFAKAQTVNKQYLFTTDKTHAVLQNKKYVGKETKDGRSVYHYTVGYDKAHLKAYIDALGSALDKSSLNDWSKKVNDSKSLSETLDISSLKSSIDSAKSNYTFDAWVDAKTKLIQSIQFSDTANPGSTFTLAQNYVSGTNYPFTFSYQGKKDGTTESTSLKLAVDTATDKETGAITVNSGSVKLGLTFTVTPSTNGVQVAAPSGAQSVLDLLSGLGLGSF